MSKRSLSIGLTAALLVAVSVVALVSARAQETTGAIVPPVRHNPSAPAFELPAVPPAADRLSPMTLAVTTRVEPPAGAARATRQVVLRTSERVLVTVDGTDSEWLFERNPADHRRVSGYLVDHKLNRILAHQESDLRNGLGIRGWMDVMTLRFDASMLTRLRSTAKIATFGGASFGQYVAHDPGADGIVEVWWSDALLFPRLVVTRQAGTRVLSTVESLSPGVDESRLAPPATRFPSYAVLDVTDAREHGRSEHPRKSP